MTVFFNVNGTGFKGARVPAAEAGLTGFYHDGVPWKPDPDAVRRLLPAAWRKAFDAAPNGFWFSDDAAPYLPVYGAKGRLLTTVYAHPLIEGA